MLSWQLPTGIPADIARHLVRAGLISAFVVALAERRSSDRRFKECRGAFSAGFSTASTCAAVIVLKKTGNELIRVPLPQ